MLQASDIDVAFKILDIVAIDSEHVGTRTHTSVGQ